ncbi:fimbria/pilus periplasmic chaperone [Aeromonas caviae]|uniref:fimbria/pilus periplasmic chaperone n=1 Tax=Aeromonas caviae TaxID=648 RepID=UPI001F41A1B7|nr:fimbria/pilus periplasmic chaperone [Aeromonas caviae]
MHRLLWPLLGGLLASQAAALDIGAMTLAMAPEQEFITRTLTNNSASPKLYDIQMEKISDPTARGRTLPTVPGELLFAPRRFTLHARHAQNVKFYYKGPADDHERYYRITFTESPAAQVDEGSQTQHRGTVEVKLALLRIPVKLNSDSGICEHHFRKVCGQGFCEQKLSFEGRHLFDSPNKPAAKRSAAVVDPGHWSMTVHLTSEFVL